MSQSDFVLGGRSAWHSPAPSHIGRGRHLLLLMVKLRPSKIHHAQLSGGQAAGGIRSGISARGKRIAFNFWLIRRDPREAFGVSIRLTLGSLAVKKGADKGGLSERAMGVVVAGSLLQREMCVHFLACAGGHVQTKHTCSPRQFMGKARLFTTRRE